MDLTDLSQYLALSNMFVVENGRAISWTRNWNVINCTDTQKAEGEEKAGKSFETRIILSAALFGIPTIAAVIWVICRKQTNERKKRKKEMKMV